ncbi:MAG: 4a-hydroxytetrahydrobiopterin dehydratase [Bacteriovoracaceae bacterium]
MKLHEKKCIPCSGGVPPLPIEEINRFKKDIDPQWELTHENTRLLRKLKLNEMKAPMELALKIAQIADEQWHHPELHIGFGHLDIEIWTHKINALVESDFIFAAKVDQIINETIEK